MVIDAIACLSEDAKIFCVFPSKVITLVVAGGIDPMFTPEIISPKTGVPAICKLPKVNISPGILAETTTLSTDVVELFVAVNIK